MMIFFIFIFLINIIIITSSPSVYLHSPRSNEVIIVDNSEIKNQTKTNLKIHYEVFEHDVNSESLSVCFDLKSSITNEVLMKLNCLPTKNQLEMVQFINNLYVGDFLLTIGLRNTLEPVVIMPNSILSIQFSVKLYSDLLPKITILSEEKVPLHNDINSPLSFGATTKEGSDKLLSDIILHYHIGTTPLSMNEFKICIRVLITNELFSNAIGEALSMTCMDISNLISLSNLEVGHYAVFLLLGNNLGKFMLDTSITTFVKITPLDEIIPSLSFSSALYEDVSDAVTDITSTTTNNLNLIFTTDKKSTAMKHLTICLDVHNIETGSEILPMSCFPQGQISARLGGIKTGRHQANIYLRNIVSPFTIYESSKASSIIDVRRQEEIIPSYQWQLLHAWHTIPSGLETRLPLNGNSNNKEARIPSPWRLQLPLPLPCKFFLRFDVYAHSTIYQIKEAASSQCTGHNIKYNFPSSCFNIISNDEILDNDHQTVEDVDLFNKKNLIEFLVDHHDCKYTN